jgi:2-hydroxy-4-carboxymuconate semialdehyde hemiacetal dehydrogenase
MEGTDVSEFSDLGVAIVGPGAIGDVHATALAGNGIPILGVAGPVPAERNDFADKHNVTRRYAELDELLADDDINAVIVATPSHLHAGQSLRVLEAGKHVLSEIPLGLSLAEAESVAGRAERVDRVAMVGHTLHYWEPHRRLQETLSERGIVPSQVVMRSVMLRQSNVGWTGRVRDWTDSVLWHHGGHAVDAALWHLRDPGAVDVAGGCGPAWPGSETQMDVATVLTTADRRLATVSLSYHSRIALSDCLVISPDHTLFVTEGRLLLDGEVIYDAGGVAEAQSAAVAAQDLDFARAIVRGTKPAVTAADVLPAMRVLQTLADGA